MYIDGSKRRTNVSTQGSERCLAMSHMIARFDIPKTYGYVQSARYGVIESAPAETTRAGSAALFSIFLSTTLQQ